jgi:hypothetical protein
MFVTSNNPVLIFNTWPEPEKSDPEDDDSDNDNDDDEVKKMRKTSFELELKDGLPQIPHLDSHSLAMRKEIIRRYVTGRYSEFLIIPSYIQDQISMFSGAYTNNPRAVVPWKDLTIANESYLSLGSLSNDTILCDPSKLQASAVINLWNYWRKKQAKDLPGLTFIHAKAQDRREPPLGRRDKGKNKAVEFINTSPEPKLHSSPSPSDIYNPQIIPQPSDGAGPSRNVAGPSHLYSQEVVPPPSNNPGLSLKARSSTPPKSQLDDQDDHLSLPPDCPKVHMSTKKGRLLYLKTLSNQDIYQTMIKSIERVKVTHSHCNCLGICLTNVTQIGS